MKLSVVSTLYRSSRYLEEFSSRVNRAARAVCDDYEIVLVNDGSPDDSLAKAAQMVENDSHVVVVDLSRNFGHHKAIMTGLRHCQGDLIFLLDCDLEEEPEWLIDFFAQMQSTAADVIYGVQKHRKGNFWEKLSGHAFWWLIRHLSGIAIPANQVTARLMTRRYVEALLLHEEREIFIAGLWHITGFDQHPRPIQKKYQKQTTYTLRRKLGLTINSITSFSNAPLKAIFYIGLITSAIGGFLMVYLVGNWLFSDTALTGWTSVMASIWLLGGMIISFIGVIGIYLSKVFVETKQRPYAIVRNVVRKRP